jgi:hypothetical protein
MTKFKFKLIVYCIIVLWYYSSLFFGYYGTMEGTIYGSTRGYYGVDGYYGTIEGTTVVPMGTTVLRAPCISFWAICC